MVQGASDASATPVSGGGLAPGDLVADRYRIEHLLGEGGMGAVYRAQHVHMRKSVALKVLHPHAGEFPEVVARFEREAIAAAHIDHPNVVSATDFGKLPDGSFFLVLEYVDGESLRDAIAQGPLAPARALHVVREIASALVVAHRSGVVHRDLKPENVMLVARGGGEGFEAIKVFDFGIAKIDVSRVTSKEGATLQPITRVGTVFGTPDYMAPEQAMGQSVDGRADLYALGVMLFEMLTGGRPYKGGAVTLMRQHILQDAPELPAVIAEKMNPGIGPVLKKLLAKDADGRYADAAELVAAIDAISGRAPSLPPTGRVPPNSTAPSRPPAAHDESAPSVALTPAVPALAEKAPLPVAGAAYSVGASKRKRRTTSLIVAGAAMVIAGSGAAFWSMKGGAKTAPAARATPRAVPQISAGSAPSAIASATAPVATESAESVASASIGASSAEPSASAAPSVEPDPIPSAATPRTNVSASPRESAPQRPRSNGPGAGRGRRKTGPGGIYVPPPKDWIK